MATVLYIGLGSSGARMLEEAQRFFYSTRGQSCPDHTRFLFIETDEKFRPKPVPGGPEDGRPAMEEFRTPVSTAITAIPVLQSMAWVRLHPVKSPPEDAIPVLTFRDGVMSLPSLEGTEFPRGLYETMAHAFDWHQKRLSESRIATYVKRWFTDWGGAEGFISVRLRGDKLDVFVPESLPERVQMRIETLFNRVELITRKEVASNQLTVDRIRWLPETDLVTNAGDGAGGKRSVGRIALWTLDSRDGQRFIQKLRQKIETLVNTLRTHPKSDGRVVVYIVGTFAGGTNSGMFIDIAYLCRHVLNPANVVDPNVSIMGLFLLPRVAATDESPVSNAYACLRDLDHFSSVEAQFMAGWPQGTGVPFPQGMSPFNMTTLMSLSWIPDGNLEGLYRMAGLFLYLNGTSFLDYRKARLVDPSFQIAAGPNAVARAGADNWKFSALGLTCLFFPRGEIRRCSACELADDYVLKSWNHDRSLTEKEGIDIAQWISKHSGKLRTVIDDAVSAAIQRLLEKGPGGKPAMTALSNYLKSVDQGSYPFDRQHLLSLLDTDGEIYQAALAWVKPAGNRTPPQKADQLTAIEIIQVALTNLILTQIEDTGNITFGKRVIEVISTYLEEILGMWKKLQVTNWNSLLEGSDGTAASRGQIGDILANQRAVLGVRQDLRRERLGDLLRLLGLHLLEPVLRDLKDHLLGTGEHDRSERYPGLPTIGELEKHKDLLRKASGSLLGEKEKIAEGVKPGQDSLIFYVYPAGSFAEEVRTCRTTFERAENAQETTWRRGLRQGQPNMVEFLRGLKGDAESLKEHLVSLFTQQLSEREGAPNGNAGDGNFYTDDDVVSMAQRAMTRVSISAIPGVTLGNASTHPKVVVTKRPADTATMIAILKRRMIDSYHDTHSNLACADELKDMVIFFDERPINSVFELEGVNQWETYYNRRLLSDRSVDTYLHT